MKRSRRLLRLRGYIEDLRGSLWAVPAVTVLAAVVTGTVLTGVEVRKDTVLDAIVFGGGADGARQLLTAIATSMVTVTGTVFSITIVVLQLASTTYSPRLLRQFLRDTTTKATLSAFLGTFAYCLAVLRQIRDAQQDPARDEVVPSIAVTGAVVLVLVAVALLVWFVHHITQSIRVETIIRDVTDETRRVIDEVYPQPITEDDEEDVGQDELPTPPDSATKVPASRSGYIQAVDLDILAAWAAERDVVVRLDDGPGTYLVEGATIAWVWRLDEKPPDVSAKELSDLVSDGIHVGRERTMQQDPAFGVRQLVDIAVKAMSTGLNDPTTAVQAVGGLSELLVRLARRQLPHGHRRDDMGHARVVLPRRGFGSHLSLAVDQLRRYAASDPSVVRALLELCNDVAAATPSRERRDTVLDAVERILRAAEREVADEDDLEGLHGAAERAREAAGGREQPDDEGEGDG